MTPGGKWNAWTEGETTILRSHYPNGGWAACREAGLRRGRETTQSKAHALGIREKRDPEWSPEELAVLKTRHAELTGHEAARRLLPRRTMVAIRRKARQLGLTLPKRLKWTPREDGILERHYRNEGPAGVSRRLPGRSRPSIKARAQIRGLTIASHQPWSHQDEELLKTLYPTVGAHGCAEALKRTIRSIWNRAGELGLRVDPERTTSGRRKRRDNEYSPAEDAIILEFYPKEGAKRTAERLPGRSSRSVHTRIRKLRTLGIQVNSRADWTSGELAILRKRYPQLGRAGTAELLPNKTTSAVARRARMLGIRMRRDGKAGHRAGRVETTQQTGESRPTAGAETATEVRDSEGRLIGYRAWDGRTALTGAGYASGEAKNR